MKNLSSSTAVSPGQNPFKTSYKFQHNVDKSVAKKLTLAISDKIFTFSKNFLSFMKLWYILEAIHSGCLLAKNIETTWCPLTKKLKKLSWKLNKVTRTTLKTIYWGHLSTIKIVHHIKSSIAFTVNHSLLVLY